jgi:hypothetical protein
LIRRVLEWNSEKYSLYPIRYPKYVASRSASDFRQDPAVEPRKTTTATTEATPRNDRMRAENR